MRGNEFDLEMDEILGSYNFDELDPEEDGIEAEQQETQRNPLPFDHGLSHEAYHAIFKRVHPTSSQWKNTDPPSSTNVYATVDAARQIMWRQAQREIEFVRSKIRVATGKEKPSINDFIGLFFGPTSQIGRLIGDKLKMENKQLLKVLATFYLASSYSASTKALFSKDSFINVEDLADETEYREFWRGLADYGIPRSNLLQTGDSALIIGARPLWIDFQTLINDQCRELFVSGFQDFRITVDDDKMHYDKHAKKDTQGLKRMKHVRDNVNGFVCHTAGYTASGLPIGFEWEKSHDDSGTGAAQRLIRSQLSPAIGLNGASNLTNVEFAADRGYITPELLYDFILESGANVLGTVKRCPMFPFTFDQKLKENDSREDVPTKGFKALLQKKVTYKSKSITAVAYRDGTGGVTLGVTSRSQGRHWDLVLHNPKDAERYRLNQRTQRAPDIIGNEEQLEETKWHKCILSNLDEHGTAQLSNQIYDELIRALPVTAFTLMQNTPEWFLLRILSCTSSSSDRLLRKLKLMLLNNRSRALIDQETTRALRDVLNVVHGVGWDANGDAATEPTIPESGASADQRAPEENAPVVIDGEHITLNIGKLLSLNTAEEEETTSSLKSRLELMSNEVLKGYIKEIGSKPSRERKQNESILKKWLDESPRRRNYVFLTVKQLTDACIAKFGGAKSHWQKEGKDKLIEKLSSHHHEQGSCRTAPHGESNESMFRILFKQIMLTSFMPKLSAKGKEYCKAGQRLEVPFARRLMEHSNSGLTKFRVERIYQVGLLGKTGSLYAKASCDFVAGVIIDGDEEIVGIECKARVTGGTAQREHMLAESLNGFMDFMDTELFTVIEATSNDYHLYIDNTHEAIQILHQAYVCSFRYVLLLVGDVSGRIIRGVWVHFDRELLEAYGVVLAFIYKSSLAWAYEPGQFPIPKNEITLVLQEDLKQTIDYESFIGYFYLWQYVNKKLPLPLPRLARIIPFVMSMWNAGKGVSDTVSKFVWLNIHDPPCDTVQGHAISRMLLIVAVIIHRLNHFFTAKVDLMEYPSLSHFRNAASHRSTFQETLNSIVWAVKLSYRPLSIPPSVPPSHCITGALTRRGDTRSKVVAWGSLRTGATPQKNLKQFYDKSKIRKPSELEFHERVDSCTGNGIYRVCYETKDRTGPGSRGSCAICGKLSNVWCIKCHRWLCNIALPANRSESLRSGDDPKYITLKYEEEGILGREITNVCGIFSCWHKGHQDALDADGASEHESWSFAESSSP